MRRILAEGDIRLTKSLGQTFLHDRNQVRRIVEAAELERADKVIEIGPGLGPLTERLLAEAGDVLAIEKDRRLVEFLQRHFPQEPAPPGIEGTDGRATLDLRQADALEFLRQEERDWSEWKVVSNLPYAVASPILVELAQLPKPPRLMVVTLQWEVACRVCAQPGGPEYGVLTLLVQQRYEPQGWFKIPASCFFPEPKVHSGCVKLARRLPPLIKPTLAHAFARLVKVSFSQRRKMMIKLLRAEWPPKRLETAFEHAGLSPHTRAETVSLSQFIQLTELLSLR